MPRKRLDARLDELERLEAQRAATRAAAEDAALHARVAGRLRALGFTGGDYRTVCECCRWDVPGIARYSDSSVVDPTAHRCYICGARVYGHVAPQRSEHLPVADYVCPRCGDPYTGPRRMLTPCMRCGWFTPRPSTGTEDAAVQSYVVVVALGLARAYGLPAAAAWLDCDETAAAEALRECTPWYHEIQRSALAYLRDAVAENHIQVRLARFGDGRPSHPLCSGVSPGAVMAGDAPPAFFERAEGAAMLEHLLAGYGAVCDTVIADAGAALAALEHLSTLDAAYSQGRPADHV